MELLKRLVDLAVLMSKEQREQAISLLDEIKDKVPAEAKDIVENLRKFIESYQWDDAWNEYEALAAIVQKYDPPQEPQNRAKKEKALLNKMIDLASIMGLAVCPETRKDIISEESADLVLDIEDKIKELVGEDVFEVEIQDTSTELFKAIRGKRWCEAFKAYFDLHNLIIRFVIKDPVISTRVSEETYKGYKERAKYYGETLSSDVREVIEGRRTPWVPSDGVKAAKRIKKMAKEEKADWEKRIEEALKPVKADWEKDLEELFD